jgi:hypothetical protein
VIRKQFISPPKCSQESQDIKSFSKRITTDKSGRGGGRQILRKQLKGREGNLEKTMFRE